MTEALQFMAAPFALGVLLIGIHAYLGLHVLARDVIFVDISLSQVAALGGALGLLFVHDHGGYKGLLLSLGLCLVVSMGLAALRRFEKSVSQEAIIGMTYAFAGGALILVADRLPHGADHLKEALIGNILFVTWTQVFETLAVYIVIGALHLIFRRQFWRASRSQDGTFWWDFFFYFLFGIVITLSTRHAGVLVVFSILVAPAALASRLTRHLRPQLFIAWGIGLVGLAAAFLLSYAADLPSGASIVCCLTGMFFLSLVIRVKKLAAPSEVCSGR